MLHKSFSGLWYPGSLCWCPPRLSGRRCREQLCKALGGTVDSCSNQLFLFVLSLFLQNPSCFQNVCVSAARGGIQAPETQMFQCAKKEKKKKLKVFFPLKCVVWHSNCDKRSVLKCSLPSGLLFHFLPMLGRMLLVHSPPPALGLQHSSGLDSWFPGQLVLIH